MGRALLLIQILALFVAPLDLAHSAGFSCREIVTRARIPQEIDREYEGLSGYRSHTSRRIPFVFRTSFNKTDVPPSSIDPALLAQAETALKAAFAALDMAFVQQFSFNAEEQGILAETLLKASAVWLRGHGVRFRIHENECRLLSRVFCSSWIEILPSPDTNLNRFADDLWKSTHTSTLFIPAEIIWGRHGRYSPPSDNQPTRAHEYFNNLIGGSLESNSLTLGIRSIIGLSADWVSSGHENRHRILAFREMRGEPYLFYGGAIGQPRIPRHPKDPRFDWPQGVYDRGFSFQEIDTFAGDLTHYRQILLDVLEGRSAPVDLDRAWKDLLKQDISLSIGLRLQKIVDASLAHLSARPTGITYIRNLAGKTVANFKVPIDDALVQIQMPLVHSSSPKDPRNFDLLLTVFQNQQRAVQKFVDVFGKFYRIREQLKTLDPHSQSDRAQILRLLGESFPNIPDPDDSEALLR